MKNEMNKQKWKQRSYNLFLFASVRQKSEKVRSTPNNDIKFGSISKNFNIWNYFWMACIEESMVIFWVVLALGSFLSPLEVLKITAEFTLRICFLSILTSRESLQKKGRLKE